MENETLQGFVQEVLMDDDEKRMQQFQRLHRKKPIECRDFKEQEVASMKVPYNESRVLASGLP